MEVVRHMSHTAVLAGAVLVACVVLALLRTLRSSPKDAPPIMKLGMPVLGNIRAFLRSPLNLVRECYEK